MTTFSPSLPPWQSRPQLFARFGLAAEVALRNESGRPVSVEAFEVGQVVSTHRTLKIVGLLCLAPIWIPAFLMLSAVLAIPSMIYVPFRTWREWNEARSLGVSSAAMILTVAFVIGVGFWGGALLTLILLGRLLPKTVVIARLADRTALLHQSVPMLYFPQFSNIEYVDHSAVSRDAESTSRKIILRVQRCEESQVIVVRRGMKRVSGDPEINEANLVLLLRPGAALETVVS